LGSESTIYITYTDGETSGVHYNWVMCCYTISHWMILLSSAPQLNNILFMNSKLLGWMWLLYEWQKD